MTNPHRLWLHRTWLPALLLLAGCESQLGRAPVVVQPVAWSFHGVPGTILRTPHYELHTTCRDPVLLDALPRILEGAYSNYAKTVPASSQPSQRMVSYVFSNRDQWEIYTRLFAGERAATYFKIRTGGYEENGVTAAYYSHRGVTLSVLTHEGLHQYLSCTGRRDVPPWLNEGLACYFEGFDLDDNGWPIFSPKQNLLRLPSLRMAIRKNRLYTISELISMDAGRAVRAGEEHARTYYAQIWALILFLQEPPSVNPESQNFRRLLKELGTEQMRIAAGGFRSVTAADNHAVMSQSEAIFRYYITNDLPGFTQRYQAYMRKLAEH